MKNIILWILLALIWSSSFLAIKLGVKDIPPFTLVAIRMIISTLIIVSILRIKSLKLPRDMRSWVIMIIIGLSGSIIPFVLISYGEIYVESGLAALLMGITPIITVLFAPMVHEDETLTLKALFGVFIGILGLLVLITPSALTQIGAHFLGQLAILLAALLYAFSTLFVRKYARLPVLVISAGSMISGTVLIVILALIIDNPFAMAMPSNKSMLAVIYLGIFPTAIATLIYFYLISRVGAARISMINFVVPVVGVILGALFLDEKFSLNVFIALLMIVVAVYLVAKKPKKRFQNTSDK
ncbi:MAG: EamA family transporter [Devosiaceae bacterium]|nr:EamA family transporter [Devosiaceae bacterium]